MRQIEFTVFGEPQGKARARITRTHAYTPTKTVLYETAIRNAYIQAFAEKYSVYIKGEHLTEYAAEMVITAYYGIPNSKSEKAKKEMAAGNIRPTKKPDLDNIAKAVGDSLNGIAYKDDTQVVRLIVSKYYNVTPHITVMIRELIA